MRKPLCVFLAAAFILLTVPVRQFASGAAKGTGALAGHIYNEDMKTPVQNAVVKLRNLETLKEYVSEPTDPEGLYRIPGIEEGRYVMGVQAPSGDYNFHYSLLIKSDALAKLSLAMKPGNTPVMLQQGTESGQKKSGSFFKSPAGILALVAVVEIAGFVLLAENEASGVIID